jgi:hypothetical protein
MRFERLNIILCCCFIALFFSVLMRAHTAFGQKGAGLVLNGTVYNAATKKPVASGSVFVSETKKGTAIDAAGRYAITVPKQGTYILIVQSDGFKPQRERININANLARDFALAVVESRDTGITITAKRDIQKVSRHTMTSEQIKEVPASFGDSINALTALPGVIHSNGGFFGPLIIRGGPLQGNRYLVDEIPIYSPLHYGGLESVINTNIIKDINLYSSSFPTEFGSATAAVISYTTQDEVKRFSGYTDLSALSANALVQTPILKNESGGLALGSPFDERASEKKNVGYIIGSGRIGYYDFIVLPLYQLVTGTHIEFVPRFWDYQFKIKYKFDQSHSITVFALGSRDYLRFMNKPASSRGQDLLTYNLQAKLDEETHGQSINYTYQPSDRFSNKLILFSSLKENHNAANIPAPGVNAAFQDMYINTKPYIFGLQDKFKISAVPRYFDIRGGVEYSFYYFRANTKKPIATGDTLTSDITQSNYVTVITNNRIINHTIGGYIEPKITYEGLTIMPGFRSEYLERTGQKTWDPRGLISYEFETGTTISAAGGKYSYFFQTNPMYFNGSPEYAKIKNAAPAEWALHRAVGLEQALGLFKIKVEGFYNDFFDLLEGYLHYGPDYSIRETMSTGRMRAYGAEVMLSKDRMENENGFFGWINYAYTRSIFQSGLPPYPYLYGNPFNNIGDLFGNRWLNYRYEQNHSLKVVAGYALNRHSISAKFQFYTSAPYTPIVFSQQDLQFYQNTGGASRYVPVYGRPQSRHYPPIHRLDLRYSNTTVHSWGHVTWYIEIIGFDAIFFPSNYQQTWDYRLPYLGSRNPKVESPRNQLNFFPNFGVEVKF